DHIGRPTVAREGGRRVCSEILSTRAASVPLPPVGIIAIALDSRLLATWTANHRPGSLLSTKQIRKLESRTAFLLRFTLTHPHVQTIIVGTLHPEHLAENLQAISHGPLSSEVYTEAKRRPEAVGERPAAVA